MKAINVSAVEDELHEAALELVRLLDTPEEIKFLVRLIIREIIYRLSRGAQESRLTYSISS